MGDSYREYLKNRRQGSSRRGYPSGSQEDLKRAQAIKARAQREERARAKKWLTEDPGNGLMRLFP